MDPLTQGTLGAALPQSLAPRQYAGLALLCGVLGGMAPDLDVLIRSSDDPLLFLEYHRQFTHSLIFIPLGTGIVTLLIWSIIGRSRDWRLGPVYGFTLLGYATHALLDACTTYGTQLWWPFSDQRVAWNTVSIIDPLFTLPLLAGVLTARWQRKRWPAALGLFWALSYLALGLLLRDQAIAVGEQLARVRGHAPTRVEAKPSFANIVLWKTVYRSGDRYYVDAIRVLGEPLIYEGESIAALDIDRDLPWLTADSVQAQDVERFRWFSNGYVAQDPHNPHRVIDLRYSLLPNEIAPLWSIALDPDTQHDAHVRYLTHRNRAGNPLNALWQMLSGQKNGRTMRPLSETAAEAVVIKDP